jgi:HK97 family phage major capsid protein
MELTTKRALEDYVRETARGSVMEAFAEFRTEQEKRAQEDRKGFDLALANATKIAKANDDPKTKGLVAAQMARAWAAARGNAKMASEFATKVGMDDAVVKALATSPGTAGGFTIPPGYSNEIIELLYNRVAVRSMGARTMPMPNGSLTIPKLTAGITATYIGENQPDTGQQPQFGVISATWKKLRATVPISNDLLLFSDPKTDVIVRDDMTNSFAQAEDAAFLLGPGTGLSPKGIVNWIPAANIFGAGSADGSDLTLVIADLFKLPRTLEQGNIPFTKPGWIMSPRSKYFLMQVRDSVGNFYFLEEMRRGTLLGYPYVSTAGVPNTGYPSTSDSFIVFGNWDDAVVAESSDLVLDSSTEASYWTGTALVSAFANDLTLIRGIARHDFIVRREESFAMLNDLQWGV